MIDEAVSQYLDAASSKGNFGAIDFFISRNAMSQDRGSMSAAWLRGVNCLKNLNLKRRLKAEWEATAKARKEFWDRLDEQQRDQMYCKNLEESVVGDKLYIAVQHSNRVRKDVPFETKVPADDLEQDQDTATHRSTSETTGNKRWQTDILLGSPEEQEQPQQKKKRQQQQPQQQHEKEEDLSPQSFFDPTIIIPSKLEIEGIGIGTPFKRLQEEAAVVVNDVKKTLTLDLLPFFLAANHIWDVIYGLPGILDEDHDAIQDALRISVIRLSDPLVLFCRSLEHDMKSTGYIRSRETHSRDQDALLVLFQQASQKLPKRFLPFKHLKNEDTHAHSVLDALLTFMFPSHHHRYELHWANRPSAGSGDRRNGDAFKPDATVTKDGFELGYVEIKPPKEERHQRLYLEDVWALSGLAKDNIDLHFRHRRIITTISCVLVFGFQMTLYQLSFQAGIYLWQDVHTSYLPKDHYDIANIVACVELLKTFKAIMDKAETERYTRTPTRRVEDDEELSDLYRPRPSNITPSKRPFFCSAKRTSI
ncbi:MAG: hypothetical protein J3R72DRAFT_463841 [Linnemannia gamsii]|nr:MAG: hypothetical protein J3R72DRAFT_463841 [Linnemannia gamsii]